MRIARREACMNAATASTSSCSSSSPPTVDQGRISVQGVRRRVLVRARSAHGWTKVHLARRVPRVAGWNMDDTEQRGLRLDGMRVLIVGDDDSIRIAVRMFSNTTTSVTRRGHSG